LRRAARGEACAFDAAGATADSCITAWHFALQSACYLTRMLLSGVVAARQNRQVDRHWSVTLSMSR